MSSLTGHWGTVEELWSRHELEDLLDALLRRHQLGEWTGGGQGFGRPGHVLCDEAAHHGDQLLAGTNVTLRTPNSSEARAPVEIQNATNARSRLDDSAATAR